MKKIIAILLVLTTVVGCSSSSNAYTSKVSDANSTILTINGTEVKKQDLYEYLLAAIGVDILDQEALVIVADIELTDKDAIEAKVNEKFDDYMKTFGEDADKYFKTYGYADAEDFKEKLCRPNALTLLLMEKYINENYEDILAAYSFRTAKHIQVATKDEVPAILDRLSAGEDFAAIAKELSTDTTTASSGGDLGLVSAETTSIDENLVAAISVADKVGLINGSIATANGYSIVYIDEVDAEVLKDQIATYLTSSENILEETKSHYYKKNAYDIYEKSFAKTFSNYVK